MDKNEYTIEVMKLSSKLTDLLDGNDPNIIMASVTFYVCSMILSQKDINKSLKEFQDKVESILKFMIKKECQPGSDSSSL